MSHQFLKGDDFVVGGEQEQIMCGSLDLTGTLLTRISFYITLVLISPILVQ
jgi:hypothetical protein